MKKLLLILLFATSVVSGQNYLGETKAQISKEDFGSPLNQTWDVANNGREYLTITHEDVSQAYYFEHDTCMLYVVLYPLGYRSVVQRNLNHKYVKIPDKPYWVEYGINGTYMWELSEIKDNLVVKCIELEE